MIPKVFSNKNPKFAVGNDQNIALQMKQLGVRNVNCSATEVVIDKTNKILSTPGLMGAKNIMEVYEGIHKLVRELKNLITV
jgi:enhancing lycopene biosynthesis protein 2